MPAQLNFTPLRAFLPNGKPAAGAKATFFESGSTTPLTVYTTEALDVAHSSPVLADAEGVFPQIWVSGSDAVKVAVTSSSDVMLDGYPADPVQLASSTGSAASSVSFAPITGNAATNVQQAIQNLTDFTNAAEDFGGTSPFATAAQGEKADAALPAASFVKADQTDAETGTDNDKYMTALRTKEAHDAFSPVKAWVNFDGTGTPTIRESFNVSSITDNGVGDYTINFTEDMEDANYALILTTDGPSTAAPRITSLTASSARIFVFQTGSGSGQDASIVCATVIR